MWTERQRTVTSSCRKSRVQRRMLRPCCTQLLDAADDCQWQWRHCDVVSAASDVIASHVAQSSHTSRQTQVRLLLSRELSVQESPTDGNHSYCLLGVSKRILETMDSDVGIDIETSGSVVCAEGNFVGSKLKMLQPVRHNSWISLTYPYKKKQKASELAKRWYKFTASVDSLRETTWIFRRWRD